MRVRSERLRVIGASRVTSVQVASHSAFLLAIFNAVFLTDDAAACTWFGTGEMRSVLLTFEDK